MTRALVVVACALVALVAAELLVGVVAGAAFHALASGVLR